MLGKIKNWLGVESVKIRFDEEVQISNNRISGFLIIESHNDSIVNQIEIEVVEKYQHGFGKSKRVEEFILGTKTIHGPWKVSKEEFNKLPFEIEFERIHSKIEKMEQENMLIKPLARMAKLLKGVHSEYRIQVKAIIKNSVVSAVKSKIIPINN